MTKTYDDFFEALGMRESSGRYDAVNNLRYLGKYQMGEEALMDTRYYRQDGHQKDNKFSNQFWTGKDGVHSKTDFLNNHHAQENAVRAYAYKHWQEIKQLNLDLYVGKTVHGYYLTISGMLAGTHILGVGGLLAFIKTGLIKEDKNKVRIVEYIEKFAGYDTPFSPRKKLTGLQKNKQKKTIMYLIDDKQWVTKATAIEMVKNKEVDGVIVATKNGNIFLRTRPDYRLNNNLE